MSYKTILVHAQANEASSRRVALALSVAGMFDAAVYGVAAETWFPMVALPEFGTIPAEMIDELEREARTRLDSARLAFEDLAKPSGHPFLWASVRDDPCAALTDCAQGADLMIADRSRGGADMYARPADLVLTAGLPVLLMSDRLDTLSAERVVVGWKNTRASRRALSDALPFLRRASQVQLVRTVREAGDADARAELDEVAGRLLRHGVNVLVETLVETGDVGVALERYTLSQGADLLVLGAYSHSRVRETVFGGVTQGFLDRGEVHVLLSH